MGTEAMTQTGRVVWHELSTTDVDKAAGFFADLLGWEIEVWKQGEFDYKMISVGGQTHGGFQPAQGGAPSHWVGHIRVEDVDSATEVAKSRGATILAGPIDMPEVGRFAFISDPQGAVCSLYRPESEGQVGEGVFAWDELLTTDVAASTGFYEAVVGWTTAEMDMGDQRTYTLFKRGGDVDAAGCMQKPEEMPGNAAWLTYLATTDTDATAAKAESLGGSVLQPPFDVPGVARLAVIADPTGAVVGLFQPAA